MILFFLLHDCPTENVNSHYIIWHVQYYRMTRITILIDLDAHLEINPLIAEVRLVVDDFSISVSFRWA
jgi:hypothetical protein